MAATAFDQTLLSKQERDKQERERLVFESFAKAANLLPGGKFHSQPTPEPDILYVPDSGTLRAFELVELIDQDFSATLDRQLGTKEICQAYLDALPEAEANAFRAKYGDADIFIGFRGTLTLRRRKNLLTRVFGELCSLQDGFTGDVLLNDGGPLDVVLDRITIHRGVYGPLFDAPGITWVGDPTVDALRGKMAKRYVPKGELSLLAHIGINPMFPDEVWLTNLDAYLATLDGDCQFAHIYVFDCGSDSIRRTWRRPSALYG